MVFFSFTSPIVIYSQSESLSKMNPSQLLKLLVTNRELIQRNNIHAAETLLELNKECAGSTNEEIILQLQLNNSLAELNFHSHYDNAIQNSLLVINKFKDSHYPIILGWHYWLVGHCYAFKGNYNLAEENLLKAMKLIAGITPIPVSLKSDILVSLAMNEEFQEKGPEKSIQYLEEVLDLVKNEINSIRKANCLMALGNVYLNAERNEEALDYYFAAAVTFEHYFDLSNMACAYSNIGTAYIKLKNYKEAEKFLEKSLELRIKAGSPDHLSISYYNLALLYKDIKKFDSAQDMLRKSKEILLRTGSRPYLELTEAMIEEVALAKSATA